MLLAVLLTDELVSGPGGSQSLFGLALDKKIFLTPNYLTNEIIETLWKSRNSTPVQLAACTFPPRLS